MTSLNGMIFCLRAVYGACLLLLEAGIDGSLPFVFTWMRLINGVALEFGVIDYLIDGRLLCDIIQIKV